MTRAEPAGGGLAFKVCPEIINIYSNTDKTKAQELYNNTYNNEWFYIS